MIGRGYKKNTICEDIYPYNERIARRLPKSVEDRHCQIYNEDGQWLLGDLSNDTGTFVHLNRYITRGRNELHYKREPVMIKNGTQLIVGGHLLEIKFSSS